MSKNIIDQVWLIIKLNNIDLENIMDPFDFTCNNPGTFDCLLLGIIWAVILNPLARFFALFGLEFEWSLYRP